MTIDDLPPEVRQRLRAQIAAETRALPSEKGEPNPDHWQGKEKDLQQRVNAMLDRFGFAPRSTQSIEATSGKGGKNGWRIHVCRNMGNPILLDVLLLHHSGQWLEFELKTAKGKLSNNQQLLLQGMPKTFNCYDMPTLVCRSLEEVEELVTAWLNKIEKSART